jgi:hypothetical protein
MSNRNSNNHKINLFHPEFLFKVTSVEILIFKGIDIAITFQDTVKQCYLLLKSIQL